MFPLHNTILVIYVLFTIYTYNHLRNPKKNLCTQYKLQPTVIKMQSIKKVNVNSFASKPIVIDVYTNHTFWIDAYNMYVL